MYQLIKPTLRGSHVLADEARGWPAARGREGSGASRASLPAADRAQCYYYYYYYCYHYYYHYYVYY